VTPLAVVLVLLLLVDLGLARLLVVVGFAFPLPFIGVFRLSNEDIVGTVESEGDKEDGIGGGIGIVLKLWIGGAGANKGKDGFG